MSNAGFFPNGTPRPRKSLGQVYLQDRWPVDRIADRLSEAGVERVVEIGPGPGILTHALLNKGFALTVVEKDERFLPALRVTAAMDSKLSIVHEDVLKFDLGSWLAKGEGKAAVVGNIPYNISSPILMWLLPHMGQLDQAIFLVQKEFAERVNAEVGIKAYGSLTVYAKLRCQTEYIATVSKRSFKPIPKVDSALLGLRPREDVLPEAALKAIEKVSRCAFNARRKMLRKSLQLIADEAGLANLANHLDLTRRPETLSEEEFILVAKHVNPESFS